MRPTLHVAGHGQRLPAEQLREAIQASISLQKVLLLYAHSFMTQSTDTGQPMDRLVLPGSYSFGPLIIIP